VYTEITTPNLLVIRQLTLALRANLRTSFREKT